LPYREELLKLVGNPSYFQPTVSAIDYGNYLKSARHEVVALHFWLFLIGETFGAQHISDYIAKKYPQVGEVSKNFEDMKLMTVRGIFNKWIDTQFSADSDANYPGIDFKAEIGVAYAYMTHLFDAADTAPRVSSYQSAVSAFSRLFN
jgi:uncharacterized protein with HEPN domain